MPNRRPVRDSAARDPSARKLPVRDLAIGLPAAAIAGLLVGVLGTFKYQVGVSLATGAGFPTGLVLGLAMVAVFLLAVRLGFPSRWFAVAAAVGVVAAIGVLTRTGPGGSVVVLQNATGMVWSIAPALVALAVVGPPRFHRSLPRPAAVNGILADDPTARPAERDPSGHDQSGEGLL